MGKDSRILVSNPCRPVWHMIQILKNPKYYSEEWFHVSKTCIVSSGDECGSWKQKMKIDGENDSNI